MWKFPQRLSFSSCGSCPFCAVYHAVQCALWQRSLIVSKYWPQTRYFFSDFCSFCSSIIPFIIPFFFSFNLDLPQGCMGISKCCRGWVFKINRIFFGSSKVFACELPWCEGLTPHLLGGKVRPSHLAFQYSSDLPLDLTLDCPAVQGRFGARVESKPEKSKNAFLCRFGGWALSKDGRPFSPDVFFPPQNIE